MEWLKTCVERNKHYAILRMVHTLRKTPFMLCLCEYLISTGHPVQYRVSLRLVFCWVSAFLCLKENTFWQSSCHNDDSKCYFCHWRGRVLNAPQCSSGWPGLWRNRVGVVLQTAITQQHSHPLLFLPGALLFDNPPLQTQNERKRKYKGQRTHKQTVMMGQEAVCVESQHGHPTHPPLSEKKLFKGLWCPFRSMPTHLLVAGTSGTTDGSLALGNIWCIYRCAFYPRWLCKTLLIWSRILSNKNLLWSKIQTEHIQHGAFVNSLKPRS